MEPAKKGDKMKWAFILALFLMMILGAGCVSQSNSSDLQARLENAQKDLNDTRMQLQYFEEQYNASQAQISILTNEIKALNDSLTNRQQNESDIQTQLDLYKRTFGAAVYAGVQPQEACGSGNPINLISNSMAADASWQRVQSFLLSDKTSYLQYTNDFVCCDYASQIYNDAQAAGIRSAFVVVHFSDGSLDHALNAFHTTDRGLVYTDSTGQVGYYSFDLPNGNTIGNLGNDNKIAYVAIGKTLGLISLSTNYGTTNYGTTYSDYEQWVKDKNQLEADLNDYNNRVEQYNAYPYSQDEYIALRDEGQQLNERATSLGTIWDPMGTVARIEIYW